MSEDRERAERRRVVRGRWSVIVATVVIWTAVAFIVWRIFA